jgi:F0F1-type ATP synthase assembly protein I
MADDSNPNRKAFASNARDTLIKADHMLQIAFMLPAAAFVGWIAGALLDLWLHQHWIYIAGIMLGIAAGFVQIFRMLQELDRVPGRRPKDQPPPAGHR